MAWANDSRNLFYTVLDHARRPCRLYRHLVGTNPAADPLVYFEADESFFLDVSEARSRRYLLLDLHIGGSGLFGGMKLNARMQEHMNGLTFAELDKPAVAELRAYLLDERRKLALEKP